MENKTIYKRLAELERKMRKANKYNPDLIEEMKGLILDAIIQSRSEMRREIASWWSP